VHFIFDATDHQLKAVEQCLTNQHTGHTKN